MDRVLWLVWYLRVGAHLHEDLPELVGHLRSLGLQLLDVLLLVALGIKWLKVALVLSLLLFQRKNILRHGTSF